MPTPAELHQAYLAKRLARVRELAAEGLSPTQIAGRLNIPRTTLNTIITTHDIKLAKLPRTPRSKKVKSNDAPPRVVTFKAVRMPTGPVRCLWAGCERAPFELGKPFCAEHHKAGGGLFR